MTFILRGVDVLGVDLSIFSDGTDVADDDTTVTSQLILVMVGSIEQIKKLTVDDMKRRIRRTVNVAGGRTPLPLFPLPHLPGPLRSSTSPRLSQPHPQSGD